MRNSNSKFLTTASPLLALLCCLLGVASCGNNAASAGDVHGQPTQANVQIDWVDFMRFGGITYVATFNQASRQINSHDLGPIFATVHFKLDGNIHSPNYQAKDGDAALLQVGTKIYSLNNYKPSFRLAAYVNGEPQLYEADTNPAAKTGADLLDIAGKVAYIGIISEQDGVTERGAIKDATMVASLVSMILQAPVNQQYQSQGSMSYFIALHLIDGTLVLRAYWSDSGELSRGILLPKAFASAIAHEVHQ